MRTGGTITPKAIGVSRKNIGKHAGWWRAHRLILHSLALCLFDETGLWALIQQADVLHLSGGGYRTGMTCSRPCTTAR